MSLSRPLLEPPKSMEQLLYITRGRPTKPANQVETRRRKLTKKKHLQNVSSPHDLTIQCKILCTGIYVYVCILYAYTCICMYLKPRISCTAPLVLYVRHFPLVEQKVGEVALDFHYYFHHFH